MPHDIAFLHTAAGHVRTFENLMLQLAPDLSAHHLVDESLLEDARAGEGINSSLAERIRESMYKASSTGARVTVCTCSTIGGVAERTGSGHNFVSMRIDRAMADEAVRVGPRILISATLGSTIPQTRDLIADSARRAGVPVNISEFLVEGAWTHFENGRKEAYLQRVASALQFKANDMDVIVLAQASMAGAKEYISDLGAPILSSPRLGVMAAIKSYHDLGSSRLTASKTG